jgi:hypothetical protein
MGPNVNSAIFLQEVSVFNHGPILLLSLHLNLDCAVASVMQKEVNMWNKQRRQYVEPT